MKKNLHIGFVGLTHLGLNYLAASAEKKFKTLGIDLNSSKTNDLKKKRKNRKNRVMHAQKFLSLLV